MRTTGYLCKPGRAALVADMLHKRYAGPPFSLNLEIPASLAKELEEMAITAEVGMAGWLFALAAAVGWFRRERYREEQWNPEHLRVLDEGVESQRLETMELRDFRKDRGCGTAGSVPIGDPDRVPAPDHQSGLVLVKGKPGKADLSGVSLRGRNLDDINLRYADLSSADLSGASLNRANLQGCDLRFARLSGAHLTEADMVGASLVILEPV